VIVGLHDERDGAFRQVETLCGAEKMTALDTESQHCAFGWDDPRTLRPEESKGALGVGPTHRQRAYFRLEAAIANRPCNPVHAADKFGYEPARRPEIDVARAANLRYGAIVCPPSALMRQIGGVEEGRISGSS